MHLLKSATIDQDKGTEKASVINLSYRDENDEIHFGSVWMPNSQLTIEGDDIRVPTWLVISKEEELAHRYHHKNVGIEVVADEE